MVSVSYTQHWRLRRMDRWMSRSDPHLAAMLAIFARLTVDEPIASIEQARFRLTLPRPRAGREPFWLGLGPSHVRPHADETSG